MTVTAPLSFAAAAEKLGMGTTTFYTWSEKPDFPFRVVKVGARKRIPVAELDHYLLFGFVPDHDGLAKFVREQEAQAS